MENPKANFRRPSASEQLVLEQFQVRLLTEPEELARCDELIVKHHYLHSAILVGEHLRYVATHQGEWLALMGFSAGSWHLRARDQFIGWTPEQRRRRRALVVNNARLLVLPDAHYPNLPSRLLKQVLARLSDDWLARWGHPVALVETFVDPEFFRGTTYKVSGWSQLGPTSGFGRHAQDFYQAHDRPKQVWVRELVKGACRKLRAEALPVEWAAVEAQAPVRCTNTEEQIGSLLAQCQSLPEFRRAQSLAYPIAGMFALIVLATFCGIVRGQRDLAAFARKLSQKQLRALGFRCDQTGRRRCPGETAFYRVLCNLPEEKVEQVLLRWQEKLLGPCADPIVAIDGKQLRHARGQQLVSAIGVQSGRWLGSRRVADNSNEIPAAQTLIDQLGPERLDGKLVVLDALHTQDITARKLHFECGADYVMSVKANQKGLFQTLETKLATGAFSPSADAGHSRLPAGTP